MEKLKVMVADESVLFRNMVSKAVNDTELGITERTVPNDSLAFEWLDQRKFDLVLLDADIAAASKNSIITVIRNKYPQVEIIVMSKDDPTSIANTLEALKYGAMDFIVKPADSMLPNEHDRLKNQLNVLFAQIRVQRCSIIKESVVDSSGFDKVGKTTKLISQKNELDHWDEADIVLIASSTGGPAALETVFSQIPKHFEKPILVVQHMPAEFTKILAQTLDKKYHMSVREGKEEELIKGGYAAIAPGGLHMRVNLAGGSLKTIKLDCTPFVNGVRPSADILFTSAAQAYSGKNVLVIILTGMGNDGLAGVSELKKNCNCYCITQSERTCIVYGMPRSVYEAGLSDEVADLNDIAGRMCQIATLRRRLV